MTSSVSRKRATAAPIARVVIVVVRACEVGTGFEPVYTDLQSVASPLGQPTVEAFHVECTGETSPSGQRDSNSRPQPWQGCALPTELCPPAFRAGEPASSASRTVADGSTRAKIGPATRVPAPSAGVACLEWRHARMAQRTPPRRPDQGAVAVTDHGSPSATASSRRSRRCDGEPFALTRHLARLGAVGGGPRAPRARPRRRTTRGGGGPRRDDDPIGRLRITYSAGPAPMGSGRGDGPATLVVAYSAIDVAAGRDDGVTVPVDAQRARRDRRPQDHVVRRERHRARPRQPSAAGPRRSSPTPPATSARAPAPTSSTSSTASSARPPWRRGCLAGVTRALVVEWCGAREVDEPLADVRRRASEAFLVSTTRDVQAIGRWDDRDLPAPGPVTEACARDVARPRGWTSTPETGAGSSSLDPAIAARLRHTAEGLVPVVAQQQGSGEVLMLALGRRRGARPHASTPVGRPTGRARAASTGPRATRRATCSGSRRSASTATATPCSSWSTRSARPATPATTPASTPTSCTASMAEPQDGRRTFGPVVLLGLATAALAAVAGTSPGCGSPAASRRPQRRGDGLRPVASTALGEIAAGRCARPWWSSPAGASCW